MTKCVQRWILYMAWAKSAPDVEPMHRDIYEQHLRDCDTCKADRQELFEASKKAVHPELIVE